MPELGVFIGMMSLGMPILDRIEFSMPVMKRPYLLTLWKIAWVSLTVAVTYLVGSWLFHLDDVRMEGGPHAKDAGYTRIGVGVVAWGIFFWQVFTRDSPEH